MGKFGGGNRAGRKLIFPAKKFTIRQTIWNYRSYFFRLLFAFVVLCLTLWLLIQLNTLLWLSTRSSIHDCYANFTLAFSNVRMEYSMERPFDDRNPCTGQSVKLLVLIMSRRETDGKRQGIRNSWALDAPDGIIHRFVIGAGTEEELNQTHVELRLAEEQRHYGDLIRYNIEDGYANLHFKMGAAFQWQQAFCPEAEFVMKTDDDTIVDLPRWQYWTERKFAKDLQRNRATFFGHMLVNTGPIRDKSHKWYVPVEHFPGNRYPDYMQGATYFGTGEAIRAVMAHTREVIGFNMDDIIYTGTLAERANVSRIDYKRIHFRGGAELTPDEPCDEQGVPLVFTFFRAFGSPEEYIKVYRELHTLKCKKEDKTEGRTTNKQNHHKH